MKVSIITVTYNSEKFLEQTIISVMNQVYNNIEYIIIDGGSKDNTLEIIRKYSHFISNWISEPDNGIYDAMNKGIKLASGDIVGFLNSDDIFYDNNIIKIVASSFKNNIECLFGDIVFVDNKNTNKITRIYSSHKFKLNYFSYGHMPPHPSFYALKSLYTKYNYFKTDYKIASDFDFLLRTLLIHRSKYVYVKAIFVKMRTGGISSAFKNKILLNNEILRACNENGIKTNIFKIYSKYILKIFTIIKLYNLNKINK